MKIAIVGGGIAGLGAAWLLSQRYDVTLYEANGYPGGHSNTVTVPTRAGPIPVDTGFIVYNAPNYPNLTRLFDHLGVATEASTMSFAASLDDGRFEYAGSLGGLFAQRSNLLRPRLWRLLLDVLRFYREAPHLLDAEPASPGNDEPTLGDFLAARGYAEPFVRDHLLPMAAAIWSGDPDDMRAFPLRTFIRFFQNHGLLQLADRPQWRTVTGGSREYVRRLTAPFRSRIRLNRPVAAVTRMLHGVLVRSEDGTVERFDQVVLATHGDQALAILGRDATPAERVVLGRFGYSSNRAILHQDPRLMPRRRAVWSSWNYIGGRTGAVSVTYWMNRLQNLDPAHPLFVSLNPVAEPDPSTVLAGFTYQHPQFDSHAIAAQRRLPDIQGQDRTWFCGSYCGYGFHEDALQSGLAVAAALGAPAPWADEVTPMTPAAVHATPRPLQAAAE